MGNRASDGFHVRAMRADEIGLAVDWAAAEGWNPGLADAQCFAVVDAGGFFVGEHEGKPAATISTVVYDDRFAFLGFYIVRPDLRGRGFGMRIWEAGMAHAGGRTVGLDGVVAQQANYRKSGFALAYNNIRYGGVSARTGAADTTVALADVPLDVLLADDARIFPASRGGFLGAWIGAPGHRGRALIRDGQLVAWGVIRPCRSGRRIGPLIAADRSAAETVFSALTDGGEGGVFIDVPEPNRAAVALATAHGLVPVFETARMYSGPIRPLALERVFGVTSLEVG
jgi:GNAT superfamily N-acetyltransferase